MKKKHVLPKPKHEYGYTGDQIKEIIKNAGVTEEQFEEAFGVNTCVRDEKLGTIIYPCDVERALWKLGRLGGVPHLED